MPSISSFCETFIWLVRPSPDAPRPFDESQPSFERYTWPNFVASKADVQGDRTILGRTGLLSAHERFLGSFGIFCFSFLPESPIVDRSGRLSRLVWSNSQIDRHFGPSVIAVFSCERTVPLCVHCTYIEVRMDCKVSTIFNRNRRT